MDIDDALKVGYVTGLIKAMVLSEYDNHGELPKRVEDRAAFLISATIERICPNIEVKEVHDLVMKLVEMNLGKEISITIDRFR